MGFPAADGLLERWRDWWAGAFPAGNLGQRGERVAAAHLRRAGLRVLARNVRAGRGEIDIVAADDQTLVIVEVKSRTRGSGREIPPLAAIDARKRRALRRSGLRVLRRLRERPAAWRIDVVTVEFQRTTCGARVGEVRWFPGYVDV